jgi:hypothetical protein
MPTGFGLTTIVVQQMVLEQKVSSSKLTQHELGGDCWTLSSPLPVSFMTWVNPLSWILTPTIVAEINACGLWSNGNRSPTTPSRVIYNRKIKNEL